jgi:hypothetical protein
MAPRAGTSRGCSTSLILHVNRAGNWWAPLNGATMIRDPLTRKLVLLFAIECLHLINQLISLTGYP